MTRRSDTAKVNALMLPDEGAASAEAQHFVGMPGAYRPGEPVLLESIGLDIDEARALIERLGLPLVEVEHGRRAVDAPVPDHFPPRLDGNLGFGEGSPVAVPVPPAAADDQADAPAEVVVSEQGDNPPTEDDQA